ncbi:MAG: cupin domain-containing protein [Promethearchaeota archaeon]|nr:MAG: cupin domain-containing protein [Candidatus Lokiarchaeota archaeon]
MKIIDINNVEVSDTPHKVDVKKLISYEYASIIHIELKPDEALKLHITSVDVCFYGLEGEGIVEIGDETKPIKKDQLIFSPAGIRHRLMNKSNKNFRFLVIKTPTPKEETKLL